MNTIGDVGVVNTIKTFTPRYSSASLHSDNYSERLPSKKKKKTRKRERGMSDGGYRIKEATINLYVDCSDYMQFYNRIRFVTELFKSLKDPYNINSTDDAKVFECINSTLSNMLTSPQFFRAIKKDSILYEFIVMVSTCLQHRTARCVTYIDAIEDCTTEEIQYVKVNNGIEITIRLILDVMLKILSETKNDPSYKKTCYNLIIKQSNLIKNLIDDLDCIDTCKGTSPFLILTYNLYSNFVEMRTVIRNLLYGKLMLASQDLEYRFETKHSPNVLLMLKMIIGGLKTPIAQQHSTIIPILLCSLLRHGDMFQEEYTDLVSECLHTYCEKDSTTAIFRTLFQNWRSGPPESCFIGALELLYDSKKYTLPDDIHKKVSIIVSDALRSPSMPENVYALNFVLNDVTSDEPILTKKYSKMFLDEIYNLSLESPDFSIKSFASSILSKIYNLENSCLRTQETMHSRNTINSNSSSSSLPSMGNSGQNELRCFYTQMYRLPSIEEVPSMATVIQVGSARKSLRRRSHHGRTRRNSRSSSSSSSSNDSVLSSIKKAGFGTFMDKAKLLTERLKVERMRNNELNIYKEFWKEVIFTAKNAGREEITKKMIHSFVQYDEDLKDSV